MTLASLQWRRSHKLRPAIGTGQFNIECMCKFLQSIVLGHYSPHRARQRRNGGGPEGVRLQARRHLPLPPRGARRWQTSCRAKFGMVRD
jgi:hypothetical protein